jgi:uncharacterized membrane protein YbaN (DUF454 family)
MSLDTIFEGTSVGVAASAAFSAVVPAVPGIAPAAGTVARPGPKSEASAEGRVEVGAGGWVDCDERSGVVSIHDRRLFRPGREAFCRALAESAVERFQARRVEICVTSSMCRLEFRPGQFSRAELARRIAAAVRAASTASGDWAEAPQGARASWTTLTAMATDAGISIRQRQEDRPGRTALLDASAPAKQPPEAPKGAPWLVDLALAGGSLTMAVAGVILPGIPALPFLLLAARHAVRLSPRIDHFWRRRPWLAALLSQAEASGSLLRLDRRSLVKMLLITVLAAAVILILHPPLPVVMALEIGVMAFVCFREAMGRLGGREVALGVPA